MSTLVHRDLQEKKDVLRFNGADYIEFYTGNAWQAAYFYRAAMGMRLLGYAGPETGQADRASYVLQQGSIRFVVTAPLRPDSEIAGHIHRHGDGVHDVALEVDDARQAWRETTRRGARSVREPFEIKDSQGTVTMASIAAYGDTIHTFVERKRYRGSFLPGYQPVAQDRLAGTTGLLEIHHVAGNVGWNEMDRWVEFYSDVLDFSLNPDLDRAGISTEDSSPSRRLMVHGDGRIRFLLHQPTEGATKSRGEEYLEYYHGPGVQHVALTSRDILRTAGRLRERGVEFLPAAPAHYARLRGAGDAIDEPLAELEDLGILVDSDEEGYTLHLFTRPLHDRRTLCFEIIQRKDRRSAGKGQCHALFEAEDGAERGSVRASHDLDPR